MGKFTFTYLKVIICTWSYKCKEQWNYISPRNTREFDVNSYQDSRLPCFIQYEWWTVLLLDHLTFFNPEYAGITFLQNVGQLLWDYMVSPSRRYSFILTAGRTSVLTRDDYTSFFFSECLVKCILLVLEVTVSKRKRNK